MSTFDGPGARLVARVMAKMNADMEREAVERLAPAVGAAVLEIGFGAGVGLQLLHGQVCPGGRVAGADPSRAMNDVAARRCRRAVAAGEIELAVAGAEALPWPDATFDGAIAVNSVQMWSPLEAGARETARVLRPGARLVTYTHAWAFPKHGFTVDAWLAHAQASFAAAGFATPERWFAAARSGDAVGFVVTRR